MSWKIVLTYYNFLCSHSLLVTCAMMMEVAGATALEVGSLLVTPT